MKTPTTPDFDYDHHGDEVIVGANEQGHLLMHVKIQTGRSEHRSIKLRFDSQTQAERLLPAIIKALK